MPNSIHPTRKSPLPLRKASLLLTSLLVLGCKEIEDSSWKYHSGVHIGDWLDFRGGRLRLGHDTIYRGDSAIALVRDHQDRILDQVLVVQALADTTTGRYIGKTQSP
ncbi:MAG: hypothetical protein IPK50_16380 [Fibrobacterota bacterium]|nr:hypothetical protein [Fibrobacterota bacterium]QQS03859.1 MAG: hypothetical protein IPK50_16380 [Fibrobacterota bacterium]